MFFLFSMLFAFTAPKGQNADLYKLIILVCTKYILIKKTEELFIRLVMLLIYYVYGKIFLFHKHQFYVIFLKHYYKVIY